MARDGLPNRSQLFLLRLWAEDLGDGNFEWRGRVQRIPDEGAQHSFHDWTGLVSALISLLPAPSSFSDPESMQLPDSLFSRDE